jgi:hypothetical protein
MNSEDSIKFWAYCICANVWAASSHQPVGYLWAVVWVSFAVATLWRART